MELTLAIIVNNSYSFITNLLSSLKGINCSQIFLLNGMLDIKSIKLFDEYRKSKNHIIIMKTDHLLRHPVAINMILAEVETKYVFIMDSDILTTEKDLLEIYKFMENNPNYKAVQGLLLYPQTGMIQSSGHLFYEYWEQYGYYNNFINNLQYPMKRQALSAGFAMYPIDIVRDLKGFDEFYIHRLDGIEFSTRISLSGGGVCCLPTAKGYHFHSLFRNTIKNKTENEIGKYWSDYGKLIKNDLLLEIKSNIFFRDFSDYIIVNCSSIKDFQAFLYELDLGGKNVELKITDLIDPSIVLQNVVPNSILKSRNKILWVCTNFMQIANNLQLFCQTSRKDDYIIDMCANVIPVSSLCLQRNLFV